MEKDNGNHLNMSYNGRVRYTHLCFARYVTYMVLCNALQDIELTKYTVYFYFLSLIFWRKFGVQLYNIILYNNWLFDLIQVTLYLWAI